MRFFPRKYRTYTRAYRVTGWLAVFVFFYGILLPSGRLFAQEYRRFEGSRAKMQGYAERAERLEDEKNWSNYVELGIATERAQWEQEAFEELQKRVEEIDEGDGDDARKENEIARAQAEFTAAREAWEEEAEEFKQTERGQFRAKKAAVSVAETDEALYLDLIARAEAAVAATAAVDLAGWEAAIQGDHDTIKQAFEAELAAELDRARGENAGVDGAELAAFEAELAKIENDIRREFETRDSFYVVRARNRYIALKRGDDLNARLASEASSAESVAENVIEDTLATLESETTDMLNAALDETENLVASPDSPDFEAAGTNWEARMEAVISSGLRSWEQAEEDLYARRLAWQQETKRSREEGQKVWEASHEELKQARDEWIGDIQLQIKEGREQWQAKIAEFRENREAAEQEMADYIAKERERWDASSKELANIVNGGGGALLETKDAYQYYDDLIKAMGNPGGGNERDRAIYDFYNQQRAYMQGAVQRFQGVLAGAEGVLSANMHSGEDHTGLLNDVRRFAGDLPERVKAIAADDYENELRADMAARSEDFVLYRRDMDALMDRNALFTERAGDLQSSAQFDYAAAATLDELGELIGKLDRKYGEHGGELAEVISRDHGDLDEAARLAAIKTDIEQWFVTATDRNRRLKQETVEYFNAGLGGYYLTGNEGDPYLMTRAEYEWELLRRERNYLAKKLQRAEAVKDYADRAFQHDAGLEMAAVTAERAAVAKTHSDLREISYQLIRGELELDPLIYKVSPAGAAMADSELNRILAERGIDRAALDRRENTLKTELGLLGEIMALGGADAGKIETLIGDIDKYLGAEISEVEKRGEHPLGIVREKLAAVRERVNAGAPAEELTNRLTAITGGAGVLRDEIQTLKDEYDFDGIRAELKAVRDERLTRPTLGMIRGDLAEIKAEVEANSTLLAEAKERLDLAKDAYRQARIDYDIIRASNSEDLIRIDLTNTTGALGAVIHQMTELEGVDGFTEVYDPLTAGRVRYLNEVSQRQAAQADLNGSEEALGRVRALEESKKRYAALNTLLGANPDLDAKTPAELADLFLEARAELVSSGHSDQVLNSGAESQQAMQRLESLRAALTEAETALDEARTDGDATGVELARAGLEHTKFEIRRATELLIAGIRGEERSRRDAFFYYLGSDAGGDPTSVNDRAREDDRKLTSRVFDLSEKAGERIAAFLNANAKDGGGAYRDFAGLLKLVNDAIAALPDTVRLDDGYGYDEPGAAVSERAEWNMLRDWLADQQTAIDAAGAEPDEFDRRTPEEKWQALLKSADALAGDGKVYRQFEAGVPANSTDAWVVDFRADGEALLARLEGVLGTGDAGLSAAYAALGPDERKRIESYGALNSLYLRDSLKNAAASLRTDLADLDANYEAVYRRESRIKHGERIAELEKQLAPLQGELNLALIEKAEHENERERLNEILALETDPAEQARVNSMITDLDERIGELTPKIDDLRPRMESLADEYRRESVLAGEAEQPGSSSRLAQAAMGQLRLEAQGIAMIEQAAQGMAPEEKARKEAETKVSAQDRIKAVLGFYQTDAKGEILRDAGDTPLLSQEFIDLGHTDPGADLSAVLAGEQSGANLMRWAERLSAFVADDDKRSAIEPEVLAAADMLEEAIREVLAARSFIDNRYATKGELQTAAGQRRNDAQEGSTKMGLVLDLQTKLEAAVNEAARGGQDPVNAALAILENPDNARLLRLYAGYDEKGAPDGVADVEAQARLDELIRLAERLRENRLAAHLAQVRGAYADMLGEYVNFARSEPLALAPDRESFLETRPEINMEPVTKAINDLAGDATFRAELWDWAADAPAEARFYRGRVIEILTTSAAEGQDLKDEVTAALSAFNEEIQNGLSVAFAESEGRADRDANLTVKTSVAALMNAYAVRGTTTKNIMLPGVQAIDIKEDFETAKATVRAKLEELAALNDGEMGPATLSLSREIREIISEAGGTVQLRDRLINYLGTLSDPGADDLSRLSDEVSTRSLLESLARFDASPTFEAGDYPDELRDFLLTRAYQKAAEQYALYTDARGSGIESERESASLNLTGINGDLANHLLLNDFAEYRAANDPVAFLAAADPVFGTSLGEYLAGYVEDRNSSAELLPFGGAAVVEQVAHGEYARLEADIASKGIAAIDESDYFAEFRDYILLRKAQDYIDRNGVSLAGATVDERAAGLEAHFEAFLNDATYTAGGKTIGKRMLLRADRDELFGNLFGLLEYAPPVTAYLPDVLGEIQAEGRLGATPKTSGEYLPAELTSISDYATRETAALLSGAGAATVAALARIEVQEEAARDANFGMRLSDAELGAIADRAGYAGASAELRNELVSLLRRQNLLATTGGARGAAEALSAFRQQKVLAYLVPARADQNALAEFLAGETTRLERIETKFFAALENRHADLKKLTKEERGNILRSVIEREGGGSSAFYNARTAEIKAEIDALSAELFGSGENALSADEQNALKTQAPDYQLAFDYRSGQELTTSGIFEAVEGAALAALDRSTADTADDLRTAARDDRPGMLRALVDVFYVNSGDRAAPTAATRTFFDAHPGMEAVLTRAAEELPQGLADTLSRESVLVDRFLTAFQESRAERAALAEIFADPAALNPDANQALNYESTKEAGLLALEQQELATALTLSVQNHREYFAGRSLAYEREIAVATEMQKFASTLRTDDNYRTARYSSYRGYIGTERKYQDGDLSDEEKYGGVLEVVSLAGSTGDAAYNDPEALLNRDDWADMLRSDAVGHLREVTNDEGKKVRIRAVYAVADASAREYTRMEGGVAVPDEEREMRHSYFEHLSNNYLDKISKLNGALNAVFVATGFADKRLAAASADVKQTLRDEYDPAAASNDISELEKLKVDAGSRLSLHNKDKIRKLQNAITGLSKSYDAAGDEFAQAARRDQISTMSLVSYLRTTFDKIETEMRAAEGEHTALSAEAERLRQKVDGKNRELAGALSNMAGYWRDFSKANDEYENRAQVQEFAETPYLFASTADSKGEEAGKLVEEYRGDAKEEYELALRAVDYLNEQMKEAAYAVYTQDDLESLHEIVAGLESGATYPPLEADDQERLLELRDRKHRDYETLTVAENDELAALELRAMNARYGDVIATRAEHIKHSMRMVRMHKASELIQGEVMRRRAIADEKEKQFKQTIANEFSVSEDDDEEVVAARNGVYARLAGMVDGGASNIFNEFRNWYWGGNQFIKDAWTSYENASNAALKIAKAPRFWPTQVTEGIIGLAGSAMTNARDRDAIGLWMGAGGSIAEWGMFQGVYYAAIQAMGVRDEKKLRYEITFQIWSPLLNVPYPGGIAQYRQARMKIDTASIERDIAQQNMWLLYGLAAGTASTGSIRRTMAAQAEYEDALAALYYFTRIPDQQTLKDRMIGYGDNQKDDPNDHPGVAKEDLPDLYKLTEEDLIYLFDQNAAGEAQYLNRTGGNNNPSAEVKNESLDITGVRDQVEYRDSFGRRYDPTTVQPGQPGALQGGYYWNGDERWTRLRTFDHAGRTEYRYAKIIDEEADLHTVYNMEEVLKVAVPHGQAIRDDRLKKYEAAGDAVAQGLQDQTFIFTERDNTYENLFNAAAGHTEGGREFTGYRMTYNDYRKNADDVFANELEQRKKVQLKEWELREKELVDRYNAWENRVGTILERGGKSWSNSENRFLQKWRTWEREFEQKVSEGQKTWDDKVKEHFTNKEEWESETRAQASEATIEKVLGDQVQALNRQLRSASARLKDKMPVLNQTAMINDAIQQMRNEMPSGGERLKKINTNIKNFSAALSTTELIKGNFQDTANTLATNFRKDMKEHQRRMKVLANVKIFEQYRQMIVQFKKTINVQNQAVENQTTAAATAQGYIRVGSKFVKKGATSNAVGLVDTYKWFDVDAAMDKKLNEFGFTPMDGNELVSFLDNKSNVEVEAYFYTQKLAVSAAIEQIQGRGSKEDRAGSRDVKVIGMFSHWVGAASEDKFMGHANRLMGNSYDHNIQTRNLALDVFQAGFGELGEHGQRPGGDPFGFYVQLKHMGEYVAKEDARVKQKKAGVLDPLTQLVNQFNPVNMMANAAEGVAMKSEFKGYDKKQLILGEIGRAVQGAAKVAVKVVTGAITNALMAVGSIFSPAGTAVGGAIGVGIALVANTIVEGFEIDERGRGGFRMNAKKWASVVASSLATLIPGSFIWGALAQLALTVAQKGFDYDEKGRQKGGWKMTAKKWDEVGAETAISMAASYVGGGMSGKGGLAGSLKKAGLTGGGMKGLAGSLIKSVTSTGINTMGAYARMQISGKASDRAAYVALGNQGMERFGSLAAQMYEGYSGTFSSFGASVGQKIGWGMNGPLTGEQLLEKMAAMKKRGMKQEDIMKTLNKAGITPKKFQEMMADMASRQDQKRRAADGVRGLGVAGQQRKEKITNAKITRATNEVSNILRAQKMGFGDWNKINKRVYKLVGEGMDLQSAMKTVVAEYGGTLNVSKEAYASAAGALAREQRDRILEKQNTRKNLIKNTIKAANHDYEGTLREELRKKGLTADSPAAKEIKDRLHKRFLSEDAIRDRVKKIETGLSTKYDASKIKHGKMFGFTDDKGVRHDGLVTFKTSKYVVITKKGGVEVKVPLSNLNGKGRFINTGTETKLGEAHQAEYYTYQSIKRQNAALRERMISEGVSGTSWEQTKNYHQGQIHKYAYEGLMSKYTSLFAEAGPTKGDKYFMGAMSILKGFDGGILSDPISGFYRDMSRGDMNWAASEAYKYNYDRTKESMKGIENLSTMMSMGLGVTGLAKTAAVKIGGRLTARGLSVANTARSAASRLRAGQAALRSAREGVENAGGFIERLKQARHLGPKLDAKAFKKKFGFDLKDINPSCGTTNCSLTSSATDFSLSNRRLFGSVSPTKGMSSATKLQNIYRGKDFNLMASYDDVITQLKSAGHGAKGLIKHVPDATDMSRSHIFNVINHRGKIFFIDGQRNLVNSSKLFQRYPNDAIGFMRTFDLK